MLMGPKVPMVFMVPKAPLVPKVGMVPKTFIVVMVSMVPIVLHLDENEDVMLAPPKSASKILLPNSSDSKTKKFELR